MTDHLHPRPWRAVRLAAVLLALTAASLTTGGSVSASSLSAGSQSAGSLPAGATTQADVPVAKPCLVAPSDQRVRADSGLDGVDPNDLTPAQTRSADARLAARSRQRGLSSGRSLSRTTVDVYVHVIKTDAGKGGVSTKRIKKQVSVLNRAYAGKTSRSSHKTAFRFKLKHIDRTRNSDWYAWSADVQGDDDDVRAKTALHRGGSDDLNLYIASLDGGLLGYATFPWDTTLARDGVVVLNASLPGGAAKGYNGGDTATHEVGHWLGLLHTFENGCTSPGDSVADTAYQADGANIFSCDTTLDTCPSKGKDPVHNFMSYGDDKCLSRFSSGQAQRMARAWLAFRAPGSAG